jgi:hypothetical protein
MNSEKPNTVAKSEKDRIWIPRLIFNNSVSDAFVESDDLSSIRVERRSQPTINAISDLVSIL